MPWTVATCNWRKVIKEVRWPGWVWAGECFFWYSPTRVVPDKWPLNGCCCCFCCIITQRLMRPVSAKKMTNSRRLPMCGVIQWLHLLSAKNIWHCSKTVIHHYRQDKGKNCSISKVEVNIIQLLFSIRSGWPELSSNYTVHTRVGLRAALSAVLMASFNSFLQRLICSFSYTVIQHTVP